MAEDTPDAKKKKMRYSSAEKRMRSSLKRRERNAAARSRVKTAARKVMESLATKQFTEVSQLLTQATSIIDKAAAKGIIHKNKAARRKSRLARAVNKAIAAQQLR